jgi:hypothetical protein
MAAVFCGCYLIVQASHTVLKLYEPSIVVKEAPCAGDYNANSELSSLTLRKSGGLTNNANTYHILSA